MSVQIVEVQARRRRRIGGGCVGGAAGREAVKGPKDEATGGTKETKWVEATVRSRTFTGDEAW